MGRKWWNGDKAEGRRQKAEERKWLTPFTRSPLHPFTFPYPLTSPCPCSIIDAGHQRHLDLNLDVPPSELEAVCSMEQWGEVYERLSQHIRAIAARWCL